MIHLKDIVHKGKDLDEIVCIHSISDIVKMIKNKDGFIKGFVKEELYNQLLKDKYIFSDGSVSDIYFLKMIENCDYNEYIIESDEFVGTFIDSEDLKIDKNMDYLFLYDDEINIMIPIVKEEYENNVHYKLYVDNLICVREFLLQKCDGCSCKSLKELLFNLYPEINTGLDEKYSDFKGMVCSECLSKMEKGIPLKNEEENTINTDKDDVTEKIDEFSSIEEILRFCGMNNKEELEKALKNKMGLSH
ncbi:MAG: hypothetical protein ACI398_07595 [Clostridium sp.]